MGPEYGQLGRVVWDLLRKSEDPALCEALTGIMVFLIACYRLRVPYSVACTAVLEAVGGG